MKRIRTRLLSFALLGPVAAGVAFVGTKGFADESSATPPIKEIMKVAFAGDKKNNVEPLCKVVVSGKGTKQDADELLKFVKDLAAAKPPRGDEDDWKKRTQDLVAAAEQLDASDKPSAEAVASFKSANDCRACHKAHRPPKKPQ